MISFDDFQKIEIRVGKILSAEKVLETDRLLKLAVDFGLKPFSSENGSSEHFVRQNVLGVKEKETTTPPRGLGAPARTTGAVQSGGPPLKGGEGEKKNVLGDKDTPFNSPSKEGERECDTRQIISGIAEFFPDVSKLVGKKCAFCANLEPRMIKGLESNGMILAVKSGENFSLLEVGAEIAEGARIT